MPERLKDEPHVQLELWDTEKEKMLSEKELAEWDELIKIRDEVMKAIEDKRNAGEIKHPYEAEVVIKYENSNFSDEEIAEIFIVSKIEKNSQEEVKVIKSDAPKCARCWRYVDTVGSNKEHPDLCHRCVENPDN